VVAAERRHRVLVVSTDPAHSLGDALDARLGPRPRRVARGTGELWAAEIDAPAAFRAFMRRRRRSLATIVERGTYLEDEDVQPFVRLSLPGVDELMALIELRRLAHERPYDAVVVDTAPTGHTLRLLAMPELLARVADVLDDMQAKHRFLSRSLGGMYRPDEADALVLELKEQASELASLLRDRQRTELSWVTLPESLAVEETRDGLATLARAGIAVAQLVVNRLTPPPPGRCLLCEGRRRAEAAALVALQQLGSTATLRTVPAAEVEPRGVSALRGIARSLRSKARVPKRAAAPSRSPRASAAPVATPVWLPWLLTDDVRLVLFAGKGGVGKTTCAAATALLAQERWPEKRWLLLSTDPAHSLADVLEQKVGATPQRLRGSLDVCEIDAAQTLEDWREEYRQGVEGLFRALTRRGGAAASFDQQVMENLIDLAPPGIDEILAVLSVSSALLEPSAPARYDVVVIDAAPTGHALRMIAMPELALEWIKAVLGVLLKYREVVGLGALAQELVTRSRQLRGLRDLMADKRRSVTVAVTRAAELPRRETVRLLKELRRHRMAVKITIVNAMTPPGCARCRRAARQERASVRALRSAIGRAATTMETLAVAPPPRGGKALADWARTWKRI
jgi:arsenite-transporting ATPase